MASAAMASWEQWQRLHDTPAARRNRLLDRIAEIVWEVKDLKVALEPFYTEDLSAAGNPVGIALWRLDRMQGDAEVVGSILKRMGD